MSNRSGTVLLAVVLTTLLLAAMTGGVLVAVMHARQMADTRVRLFVARAAAESAVAEAIGNWNTRSLANLAIGDSRSIAVSAGTVEIIRLDVASWLLEGAGFDRAAKLRAGAFVRTLQLRQLWQPFSAAASYSTAVTSGASAISTDSSLVSVHPGSSCAEAADSLAVLQPGGPADVALIPPEDRLDRFGPLIVDSLQSLADRVEHSTVDLAPRTRGASCDATAQGNWGDPQSPGSPCGDFRPLIFAPGNLLILSGSGQGVLVVAGDLTMMPGTRFVGPVLVRGETTMHDARVDGALRTTRATLSGAMVSYRACEIHRSLVGARALNRAMRRPGRWWIPQF
jgi:hypothetical protein